MDLSSLIFVALFVAWAVYLVPKALRHHEEDAVSRSIDGFSDRMRVLARREAVSATEAELVTAGRAARPAPDDRHATSTPASRAEPIPVEVDVEFGDDLDDAEHDLADLDRRDAALRRRRRARREAARQAAERRRRVFSALVLAVIVVAALVVGRIVAPAWVAAPLVLLAAWLVACRVMVRAERSARAVAAPVRKRRRTLADEVIADEDAVAMDAERPADLTDTDSIPAVSAEVAQVVDEPSTDTSRRWAPVDVPLPTYVAKAPAGRSVRTIDLDSTGVWSSGRNAADSQLAREAEVEAQRAAADVESDVEQRRATGS